MHLHGALDTWIARYLEDHAPRARSLIITLFGDTVMPYCERIWIGHLIALMAPFGVNARLVRTSVSRLAEAGWLTSQREGRRSYYTLGTAGRRRFRNAYERVYRPPEAWHGGWSIVFAPKALAAEDRARLRQELEWEGYASSPSGVFLRPTDAADAACDVVDSFGLTAQVVPFEARTAPGAAPEALSKLVAGAWSLDPAIAAYRDFNARMTALPALIASGADLENEHAFVVQTLMIDAFRWATLRDPRLPAPLLPAEWPGQRARALCRALYTVLAHATCRHLATVLHARPDALTVTRDVTRRFEHAAK